MNKLLLFIIGIIGLLAVGGVLVLGSEIFSSQNKVDDPPQVIEEEKMVVGEGIEVDSPRSNEQIVSPLIVKGRAQGTWYFEGSFSGELLDSNDDPLGTVILQAQGEWMTEKFVPFEGMVEFQNPTKSTGTLILQSANPSGLSQNQRELKIPVRFGSRDERTTVQLFFNKGNTAECEEVVSVSRVIPSTQAIARGTLEQLIAGPTSKEEQQGYQTSIPDEVTIQRIVIEDGVAQVDFNSALEQGVAGSCRVMGIRSQITETLLQFPTVDDVVISIDGRTDDILQP